MDAVASENKKRTRKNIHFVFRSGLFARFDLLQKRRRITQANYEALISVYVLDKYRPSNNAKAKKIVYNSMGQSIEEASCQ